MFQAAVDRHETVFVPIGEISWPGRCRLRSRTNLIGLHPRQTWLRPRTVRRALVIRSGRRPWWRRRPAVATSLSGLGLETARRHGRLGQHPLAVGPRLLPRGRHHAVREMASRGRRERRSGLHVPRTAQVRRVGPRWRRCPVEHLECERLGGQTDCWSSTRPSPACLRGLGRAPPTPRGGPPARRELGFLGLQTDDHIYGWQSQAVELDHCHDLLFANSVFFRVATVLGPSPYGVGLLNSRNIVFRGNRGYRDKTPEFTQWGASVADLGTGRSVPEPEFTVVEIR